MFSRIKNKVGLASVVASILIVFLAIVSAILVSVIITNFIDDKAEQLSPRYSCIDMQIERNKPFDIVDSCRDFVESEIEVRIKRSLSFGEIRNVNFIVSSSAGETTKWIAGEGCESCDLPSVGGVETYFLSFLNPEEQEEIKLYVGSCEIDTRQIRDCVN
jgi:hypothetical protein